MARMFGGVKQIGQTSSPAGVTPARATDPLRPDSLLGLGSGQPATGQPAAGQPTRPEGGNTLGLANLGTRVGAASTGQPAPAPAPVTTTPPAAPTGAAPGTRTSTTALQASKPTAPPNNTYWAAWAKDPANNVN